MFEFDFSDSLDPVITTDPSIEVTFPTDIYLPIEFIFAPLTQVDLELTGVSGLDVV